MIIGLTCAVVVAMVITGVLVSVKFHLDSTNEIVTVRFQLQLKASVEQAVKCAFVKIEKNVFKLLKMKSYLA